jgi:YegS/Rv2252/BmrU family lipid kinase
VGNVLFVYNPTAGKGQIRSKISHIVEIIGATGASIVIHPTLSKGDAYDFLRAKLEIIPDIDRIIVSGGDGTLNEAVGAVLDTQIQVPIGYIPAGTMNDFGYSLKIPRNIIKAAELAATGEPFTCDSGSINGRYFVYTAAFGLFSAVSYETPQVMKNFIGRAAYLLSGISKLVSVKPFEARFTIKDEVVEGDFLIGFVANALSVGGFHGITGRHVSFDDGLFELLLVRMPKNLLDLNEIIIKFGAKDFDSELIYNAHFSEMEFECAGEMPWAIDGEDGGDIRSGKIEVVRHSVSYICK